MALVWTESTRILHLTLKNGIAPECTMELNAGLGVMGEGGRGDEMGGQLARARPRQALAATDEPSKD